MNADPAGFWSYVADPLTRSMVVTSLLGGLPMVLMCALLSPIVVAKKLAFIGQGVSHCAFGGIGVVVLLAGLGVVTAQGASPSHPLGFAIVAGFCVVAAVAMAWLPDRRSVHLDTAIGVVLVVSMALGAVLAQLGLEAAVARGRSVPQQWEAFFFGSNILAITRGDVRGAWIVAIVVACVFVLVRRGLVFWAFDEHAARGFGVRTHRYKLLLLVMLALAVVTALKLAGVVLATALLILPGATALRVTSRLVPAFALSLGVSVLGLVGGLLVSLQFNLQAGPGVIGVLAVLFGLACAGGAVVGRRAGA